MKPFEKWLLRNASTIESADNAVGYLTMVLPGQSQSAEVASEAVASLFQLFRVYQDALVSRLAAERGLSDSLHTRYLHAQYKSCPLTKGLSYTLATLRSAELLLEIAAKHNQGERGRQKAVLAIESIKASIRLALLAASHRPLAYPPVLVANLDANEIAQMAETDKDGTDSNGELSPVVNSLSDSMSSSTLEMSGSWIMPRTGKELLANPPTAGRLLSSKILDPDDVRKPIDLLGRLNLLSTTGEILSILRPLIYAILLFRLRRNRRISPWTPWVIGIAIEYLARNLSFHAYHRNGRPTGLEAEQLKAKASSLWWWALRGQFYHDVTRPVIAGISNRLAKLPVLNLGAILVEDYLYLFDNFQFASSTL